MKNNFKIDFMCIGAAKAGTTWLADRLREYSSVCVSEPKEVDYFNHYIAFSKTLNKNHNKPFSWYKKRFQHCKDESIKGELSTDYLTDKKAPLLIKKFFPNIKLIICLRNPIDGAYSDYLMRKSYMKREHRTFMDAIRQNSYTEPRLYHKHLKKYLKHFRKDQLLIIWSEDIKNNPKKVMEGVLKFLNVNEDIKVKNLGEKSHAAKTVRFRFIIVLMNSISRLLVSLKLSKVSVFLKKIGIKGLVMNLNTSPIVYPKMDIEARRYLRKKFEKDIKKLEILLKKNLSHWR